MAGEKILFADDEEQIRKLLGTFLARRGYEVRTVADGVEALKAVRDDPPHLVISDVNMPNMNGFELTRTSASRSITTAPRPPESLPR